LMRMAKMCHIYIAYQFVETYSCQHSNHGK